MSRSLPTSCIRPERKIRHFSAAFLVLPAISVLQTIDNFPGLLNKSGVKWVNDILIGDEKVAGVIAHSHLQGEKVVSVAIGIGLNVESAPDNVSDSFVKSAGYLNDYLADEERLDVGSVFRMLIRKLADNYMSVLEGQYQRLLEVYIKRSIILEKRDKVMTDSLTADEREIIDGKVYRIGNDLELYFENRSEPVTNGRLMLL